MGLWSWLFPSKCLFIIYGSTAGYQWLVSADVQKSPGWLPTIGTANEKGTKQLPMKIPVLCVPPSGQSFRINSMDRGSHNTWEWEHPEWVNFQRLIDPMKDNGDIGVCRKPYFSIWWIPDGGEILYPSSWLVSLKFFLWNCGIKVSVVPESDYRVVRRKIY